MINIHVCSQFINKIKKSKNKMTLSGYFSEKFLTSLKNLNWFKKIQTKD